MKILVIGSGGREHALVWKLAQSRRVSEILCAPGNAGIAAEAASASGKPVETVPINADDLPGLLKLALREKAELTVVGPDNPLALGIVDLFQGQRLRIWGPTKKAAQFESSKVFSQEFMNRHKIPSPRSEAFENPEAAVAFARSLGGRCAVKADGLALGKGVILCCNEEEAARAIQQIMVAKAFGEAGRRLVIQEFLEGLEVSLHALCDGRVARLFPTAQDHKRIFDGDEGPNTGGMGAYSPTPFVSQDDLEAIQRAILDPWVAGCQAEGIDFRGVLYPGIMLTPRGPKVIEFNARFGDPEAQVYITRLENDLLDLLEACLDGTLAKLELRWAPHVSVCVVLASEGYPGSYAKGRVIRGLAEAGALDRVKVFHAGTGRQGDQVVTQGGRVLGVTAWGSDLAATRDLAYRAADRIHFEGAQCRRDIGMKALNILRETNSKLW